MKKTVSVLLALVLCLSLCACSASSSSEQVTIVNRKGETEYLTAKELHEIAEANPVAFESKYYEADVTVISEIEEIHGRTSLNGHFMWAYLVLEGGWIVEAKNAAIVEDLMVGDTVIITGKIWTANTGCVYVYCINDHTTTIEKYNP